MRDEMRGYIPWRDWLVFGGLALLAVILAGVAALTPQEWSLGKVLAITLVPLAFVVVAVIVLVTRYRTRPTYVTKYGMAVWTNGIPISQEQVDQALYVFFRVLPKLVAAKVPKTDVERHAVVESMLRAMVNGAHVEWCAKPITLFSRFGWTIKDAAGLQQGKRIMVQWMGTVFQSAFYHELLHMVDEVILGREPDYNHSDTLWWKLVADLKRTSSMDEMVR